MKDDGQSAWIELDQDGIITGWSTETERLFGWPAHEALGRRSHVVIPERNRDRYDGALRTILAAPDNPVYQREITALHRDDHEFRMAAAISRRQTAAGVRLVAHVRPVGPLADARNTFHADRYRAILDQIEDGCCVVDLRGNYLFVNDAFCRLFNYDKDTIIGTNFKDSTGQDRVNKIFDVYAEVYRTGQPVRSFEYEVFPKGRPPMFVEQSVSLERDRDGRAIGFLSITRGCTARKKAEQALDHARAAAEQANRAKSEFLANMSHEIRTPMNGVVGMSGLLLETELTPQQRDFAETIQTSAESLLTIINDILDFSKVEAGKLHFEVLDFDVRQAVEGTADMLAQRAFAKGLELASFVEPDAPVAVRGDPGRLRQVLTNLVANAVKFTERGEVLVRVSRDRQTPTDVVLRFEVKDSGIGIPEAGQDRLFEAFTQADSSMTRKYGGTGLGLAIAKRLVHLMGGEIGLRSVPGAGSTFWFTARFEKQAALPEGESHPVAFEGRRVLVVDDNETNRTILSRQLAAWRVDHDAVSDGPAALMALRDAATRGRPFDVAIVDWHMPEMDGMTVAQTVQREPAIAGVRLIMLASVGSAADREEIVASGIVARLAKPVKQAQLRECLVRVLVQPTGDPVAVSHAAPLMPIARGMRGRVLIAEDNIVNQKVTLSQLRRLGYSADAVANGAEAVEALTRIPYDIVLMDCQMPDVDGYEATRVIRSQLSERRDVPIVAMTAGALLGDREKCFDSGMNDYITKPIKMPDLRAVLVRWHPNGWTESPSAPPELVRTVQAARLIDSSPWSS